ncbi:MAG: glucoamylase family protein [Bacteroidales bacterium]
MRGKNGSESIDPEQTLPSDDSLLTRLQYETFQYFWEGSEPNSGMARERIHMDHVYPEHDSDIVTTGGTGFGVMAILVGVERGFITREEAATHFEKIIGFLEKAERYHGAWPHWINGSTGKTAPFSKKDDGGDLVETAFLVQGLLAVRQYFREGNEREKALAERIDTLWREVEWSWYTKGGEDVLYWHWSPRYEWDMDFRVGGYNECLVMYVLAASSPTHPIEADVYHKGWARGGAIVSDRTYLGIPLILDYYEHDDAPAGPMFWSHYSYVGLDPRNLKDRYASYWDLNRNLALIHHKHCVENPGGFKGYGEDFWGLSASYSPGGYAAHRPDEDLGVVSPTAALSSYPYLPEESMRMIRFLYDSSRDSLRGAYGPYDAISFESNWVLPRYLAIDQGPIPVMIENQRTGLLWDLFMSAPEVRHGLDVLGFSY